MTGKMHGGAQERSAGEAPSPPRRPYTLKLTTPAATDTG